MEQPFIVENDVNDDPWGENTGTMKEEFKKGMHNRSLPVKFAQAQEQAIAADAQRRKNLAQKLENAQSRNPCNTATNTINDLHTVEFNAYPWKDCPKNQLRIFEYLFNSSATIEFITQNKEKSYKFNLMRDENNNPIIVQIKKGYLTNSRTVIKSDDFKTYFTSGKYSGFKIILPQKGGRRRSIRKKKNSRRSKSRKSITRIRNAT